MYHGSIERETCLTNAPLGNGPLLKRVPVFHIPSRRPKVTIWRDLEIAQLAARRGWEECAVAIATSVGWLKEICM